MDTVTSLRQPKLFGISIFDVLLTLLAALAIQKYLYKDMDLLVIFLGLVVLGIVIHWVTGTPTMLNYYLGISKKPERN